MFFLSENRVFLLLGFVLLFIESTVQNPCTIPGSVSGDCVQNVDCPAYQKAFDEKFKTNVEFFRRLQCGFNESHPRICCPKRGDYDVIPITLPAMKRYRVRKLVDFDNRFFGEDVLPGKSICGKQEALVDKVLGGEITELDEFPWMALLFYKNLDQRHKFACGGALIHTRFILTAAHCVSGSSYETVGGLDFVRLGEYNVENNDEDCIIMGDYQDCAEKHIDCKHDKIILHPRYSPTSSHQRDDIALIKLKQPVEFTEFIRPICLPEEEKFPFFEIKEGKGMFVAGWGVSELGNYSPVKLKVKVPITNHTSCSQVYSRFKINVAQTQLCAGGQRGKDSCKGDSGGPLMATDPRSGNWISTGVVSLGPQPCGTTEIPGIYTNVKHYIGWIRDNLK